MGCVVRKQTPNLIVKITSDEDHYSKKDKNDNSMMSLKAYPKRTRTKGETIKITTSKMIKQIAESIETNYQILNRLGRGAFGTVYKVIQKGTGIIRALKVIKRDSIKYQDDEREFLKEIEILMKTDHPHIIKIFEYYIDSVNYFLITEYISGGDLYETITKLDKFDEQKAAVIMYQLLSAINYLHSLNIVHRDIKPENILVEKSDDICIKLIDFGTSNYYTLNKYLSLKVGTPYYIAPEVLERNYNHKIDVWSCGVLLYFLLCGSPPFTGKNMQEIFDSVKKGIYKMEGQDWRNVSQEAKSLVSKMIEYSPSKRIECEEALKDNFFKKFLSQKEKQGANFHNVLMNIKNFNAKEKFQQATLAYIVYFFDASKEQENLRNIFYEIDINKDGRLTYTELRNGFNKIFGNHMTDFDFNSIIEDVDQDNNGYIEYQEFLRVGLNKKSLLSEYNLKMAFDKMDVNKDGKLSVEEIKDVLVTSDNEYINELLKSFDTNKDSEISYQEFVKMMIILLKSNSVSFLPDQRNLEN